MPGPVRSRDAQKKYDAYRADPWPPILRTARNRAKEKGIEFTITRDDFTIPQHCPYLGVPLWEHDDEGRTVWLNQPSLDRIDPSKGYIPGNVQVISVRANRAKSDLTAEELRTFALNVLRIQAQ
jgi:hypothetical protein